MQQAARGDGIGRARRRCGAAAVRGVWSESPFEASPSNVSHARIFARIPLHSRPLVSPSPLPLHVCAVQFYHKQAQEQEHSARQLREGRELIEETLRRGLGARAEWPTSSGAGAFSSSSATASAGVASSSSGNGNSSGVFSGGGMHDAVFLETAIDTLIHSRFVLRNSFAHAFFIGKNVDKTGAAAAGTAAGAAAGSDQVPRGRGESVNGVSSSMAGTHLSGTKRGREDAPNTGGASSSSGRSPGSGSGSGCAALTPAEVERAHLQLFEHQQAMLQGATESLNALVEVPYMQGLFPPGTFSTAETSGANSAETSGANSSGQPAKPAAGQPAELPAVARAPARAPAAGVAPVAPPAASSSSDAASSSRPRPSRPTTCAEWRHDVLARTAALRSFLRGFLEYVEQEQWLREVGGTS